MAAGARKMSSQRARHSLDLVLGATLVEYNENVQGERSYSRRQ
jgi:hypothetical protein